MASVAGYSHDFNRGHRCDLFTVVILYVYEGRILSPMMEGRWLYRHSAQDRLQRGESVASSLEGRRVFLDVGRSTRSTRYVRT